MEKEFLDLIEAARIQQEADFNQPPASAKDIAELQERTRTLLAGYEPPVFYLDFLRVADGLDRNGHQLYGSKTRKIAGYEDQQGYEIMGLAEANLLWRGYEPNRQYVFFAESGEMLYCQNLGTEKFEVVDRLTKEMDVPENDAYDTVDDLIARLFTDILNVPDEEYL